MTHIALIRLDWPAPALFQNKRTHWAAQARAVAAAKEAAFFLAREQRVQDLNTSTPVLRFQFHPRTGRGRLPDLHNMPATQKAAIDGIAKAMGCDDAGFRCVWPDEWHEPVKGGAVLVEVTG